MTWMALDNDFPQAEAAHRCVTDAEQPLTPSSEFAAGPQPWLSFTQDNPIWAGSSFKQTFSLCYPTALVARETLVTGRTFFQEKHRFKLIDLELTHLWYEGWSKSKIRVNRKSWTQGWFLLKQTKHSNSQKLFEIKSTMIWARAGNKKGISDLQQWFFHDLTRSSLSNKLCYAFKQVFLFQAWNALFFCYMHFLSMKSWQGAEASD